MIKCEAFRAFFQLFATSIISLSNLLNELGKSDKRRGLSSILSVFRNEYIKFIEFIKRVGESDKRQCLPSILSHFRNKYNKFNYTGARMLDTIYHMTLKIFL